MGLQSALTTSLTGLQAAEAVIDVVGNNVANSGTVGFKESDVLFANQFLQTQSIGSAPTVSTGGTNPRQIGLGVKVAAINPDFTQGTIQISSNPLDVAIQGDGFLIVEGSQGEKLYTRNGQLQTNSANDIVTATGNRLLGFAVDENFNIDTTSGLVPLNIPLGNLPVAQATQEANFAGVLSPRLDIGTMPGIITSQALGDISVEFPEFDASGTDPFNSNDVQIISAPNSNASSGVHGGTGTLAAGNYQYRVTWFTNDAGITQRKCTQRCDLRQQRTPQRRNRPLQSTGRHVSFVHLGRPPNLSLRRWRDHLQPARSRSRSHHHHLQRRWQPRHGRRARYRRARPAGIQLLRDLPQFNQRYRKPSHESGRSLSRYPTPAAVFASITFPSPPAAGSIRFASTAIPAPIPPNSGSSIRSRPAPR